MWDITQANNLFSVQGTADRILKTMMTGHPKMFRWLVLRIDWFPLMFLFGLLKSHINMYENCKLLSSCYFFYLRLSLVTLERNLRISRLYRSCEFFMYNFRCHLQLIALLHKWYRMYVLIINYKWSWRSSIKLFLLPQNRIVHYE